MKTKLIAIALITLSSLCNAPTASARQDKPIVIITQDGEIDDRSSFVRLLLYTPDIDLRGIIATNSVWQREGHGTEWIFDLINKYGEVHHNLLLHNGNYPTSDFLKSLVVVGNEDPKHLTGDAPYADSKGSELILSELLKEETAPLHVNCWGGANTVAQALYRLKEDYPEKFSSAVQRVRIYAISFQDDAGMWIVNNIPEAMIIEAHSWCYSWNYHNDVPLTHNPYPQYMSEQWMESNIKNNHGALGAAYQQANISEGDTPAFLPLVDNGLRGYEDYSWGSWGGRFYAKDGNYWRDAPDDNNTKKALWRWCVDTQNDFAARMDWCVKPFNEANHPPVITQTTESRRVTKGEKILLNAHSEDIDGDNLYYHWWHYKDETNTAQYIPITNETSSEASFIVPSDCDNDIHIILEVIDSGTPTLKRYKRIIFHL